MAKASMRTRDEIIRRNRAKYQKSSKKEKGAILDSVCTSTGLSRDRAARLLADNKTKYRVCSKRKRGRPRIYDAEFTMALKEIWAYMDFACGKRLKYGICDMLSALTRFGEVHYNENVVEKLNRVSPATIDRLLKKHKLSISFHGISTTKPGTLLKRNIPLRLGTQWDDAVPGYVEIDLVAHCGPTTAGEYINTLNVTDICTGWTESMAVINRAQRHVFDALMQIEKRQPFPYMGIDSDNGSEFINQELYRYCQKEGICFTRSRPYQKNDNCHIEQKNWSIIRRNIGYNRYEGTEALHLLNEYYSLLRLHLNFFQPSVKLIGKERNGSHVSKRYDTPLTPYRRVLSSEDVSDSMKKHLEGIFMSINPAKLKRGMMKILDELSKLYVK
ncbi:MAG: DDE-type integrase/transposase/recombinase [Clostridia bacterium]|nr:DDE-type integrase/transposase/recombinase [Clostridia bacterium]